MLEQERQILDEASMTGWLSEGSEWPFFLRRGNAGSMGRFQTKREVLLQMVPRLMNDTRRRTFLLLVEHISFLRPSKIGEIPLSEHSTINGIVCLYKDSTDNAIQPPQWRGTFWSDKSISLPEQSITALTSIRNRQSEVRLINQMSGVMWLIEEFRDQDL
jgi:hypothetical protein